eukprot:5208438-Prymnesium_polylepis.1
MALELVPMSPCSSASWRRAPLLWAVSGGQRRAQAAAGYGAGARSDVSVLIRLLAQVHELRGIVWQRGDPP